MNSITKNGKFAIIFHLVHEGAIVLDVGCGSGELGEILRLRKKCTVIGIDIDPQAIETAKKSLMMF